MLLHWLYGPPTNFIFCILLNYHNILQYLILYIHGLGKHGSTCTGCGAGTGSGIKNNVGTTKLIKQHNSLPSFLQIENGFPKNKMGKICKISIIDKLHKCSDNASTIYVPIKPGLQLQMGWWCVQVQSALN